MTTFAGDGSGALSKGRFKGDTFEDAHEVDSPLSPEYELFLTRLAAEMSDTGALLAPKLGRVTGGWRGRVTDVSPVCVCGLASGVSAELITAVAVVVFGGI